MNNNMEIVLGSYRYMRSAKWAVKPYLYSHMCELYTDHQALKLLLNTSGKLASYRSWIPLCGMPLRSPVISGDSANGGMPFGSVSDINTAAEERYAGRKTLSCF